KMGTGQGPAVVIGAHVDTLAADDEPMPGADDDGSGTVSVLEAARLIINSGLTFKHPIYFIWYAAEEEGLVGSQHVVDNFLKQNIPVAGVLHFDCTGYVYQRDLTMWLMRDNTNPSLNKFMEALISTYLTHGFKYT